MRFTVLGSGSSGNASLLEVGNLGVLIDLGFGPRQLAGRLKAVDATWQQIHAAFLTHVHSDHWNELTLAQLAKRGITLYCHADHQAYLARSSPAFRSLHEAKLVRSYEPTQELTLAAGLRCWPVPLRHDGGLTCGFCFEGPAEARGRCYRLAYAADLGSWDDDLAEAFADVHILALEFNHDVEMERNSGRPPHLIARVLGDHGHLSNDQAAGLFQAILDRSQPARLRHLVQLHLSRTCNNLFLAQEAVAPILHNSHSVVGLHTATQDTPGPSLQLDKKARGRPPIPAPPIKQVPLPKEDMSAQPWLPGWQD